MANPDLGVGGVDKGYKGPAKSTDYHKTTEVLVRVVNDSRIKIKLPNGTVVTPDEDNKKLDGAGHTRINAGYDKFSRGTPIHLTWKQLQNLLEAIGKQKIKPGSTIDMAVVVEALKKAGGVAANGAIDEAKLNKVLTDQGLIAVQPTGNSKEEKNTKILAIRDELLSLYNTTGLDPATLTTLKNKLFAYAETLYSGKPVTYQQLYDVCGENAFFGKSWGLWKGDGKPLSVAYGATSNPANPTGQGQPASSGSTASNINAQQFALLFSPTSAGGTPRPEVAQMAGKDRISWPDAQKLGMSRPVFDLMRSNMKLTGATGADEITLAQMQAFHATITKYAAKFHVTDVQAVRLYNEAPLYIEIDLDKVDSVGSEVATSMGISKTTKWEDVLKTMTSTKMKNPEALSAMKLFIASLQKEKGAAANSEIGEQNYIEICRRLAVLTYISQYSENTQLAIFGFKLTNKSDGQMVKEKVLLYLGAGTGTADAADTKTTGKDKAKPADKPKPTEKTEKTDKPDEKAKVVTAASVMTDVRAYLSATEELSEKSDAIAAAANGLDDKGKKEFIRQYKELYDASDTSKKTKLKALAGDIKKNTNPKIDIGIK